MVLRLWNAEQLAEGCNGPWWAWWWATDKIRKPWCGWT
jgi:hypothetical protein